MRASDPEPLGVVISDFYAYMPNHKYIFAPTGALWPAQSVNSRLGPQRAIDAKGKPLLGDDGKPKFIPAAAWLDRESPVEQMTWAPGEPIVIQDRLISEGGWIRRLGCQCFNLYRPPLTFGGSAALAAPWVDHVRKVYPCEADHIIAWLAHRVQRPAEKINHALVLGGAQGIGKDTLLEPAKQAVGPWNFVEVGPQHLLGRFNGFVKSVILRVSEARDLGDIDRYSFYEHMKTYTAAPPDVLRVDEKYTGEYAVPNVCGVIITTNHKTNGIFLPADDRRHYVAWSELTKDDFTPAYWNNLHNWFAAGGIGHVAAYLRAIDLSGFNSKAPPPKTEAWHAIVDANRAPEDNEIADAVDKLGHPNAVTLEAIGNAATEQFRAWLSERKNARAASHRMEEAGYQAVRNPSANDGQWVVFGQRKRIYVRRDLPHRDAILAAQKLSNGAIRRTPTIGGLDR